MREARGMTAFDHLLHYELLRGSHPFPGEAGGACLNEVAIVAAGLDYREVKSAADCPPCFSRPIAAYVIGLNDHMPDAVRQKLKRFVLRLAGSADCAAIETARTEFILVQTVARILPIVLSSKTDAAQCAGARTLASAEWAARFAASRVNPAAYLAQQALRAIWVGEGMISMGRAAELAALAQDFDCIYARSNLVWDTAIEIIDGALRIGKQAPAPDADVAAARIAAALAPHARRTAVPA